MKKRIFSIVLVSMLTIVLGISATPVAAMSSETFKASNDINVSVTVNGLEDEEKAVLLLSPEMDESPDSIIAKQVIAGKGDSVVTNFTFNIKDGNYQLVLDTSDKYYRDPKGYLFKVQNGKIINPNDRPIAFDLIPSKDRDFKSYRELLAVQGTESCQKMIDSNPIQMEYLIALSLPPKQIPGSKHMGYHYAGLKSTYDCTGIWGKFDVVNTGVNHNPDPGELEFTCDRVYAQDSTGSYWMEVGWVEHSGQLDSRYLYEYDSTNAQWRIIFTISSSPLEVRVHQYSGNTWEAQWYNGSSWIRVGIEDVGFSTAGVVYNSGEIYQNTGSHPTFPDCYTTTSKVRVNGIWDDWDNTYSAYTDIDEDDPYDCNVITNYTYFYIGD